MVERDACAATGHGSPSNRLLSLSFNSESERKVSLFNAKNCYSSLAVLQVKLDGHDGHDQVEFIAFTLAIRSDANTCDK